MVSSNGFGIYKWMACFRSFLTIQYTISVSIFVQVVFKMCFWCGELLRDL